MIALHKLHSHVHYEMVYQYKRFQKFSIKTLMRVAFPSLKNEQKIGVSPSMINLKNKSYEKKLAQKKIRIIKNFL